MWSWLRGAVALLLVAGSMDAQEEEWPAYGRDPGGTRYSPLGQIDRANVGRLTRAWVYRTGETRPEFATARRTAFEATPLMVDGTLYLGTPLGRVIALDAETGAERWVYDPQIRRDVRYGDFANRGVATWVDSSMSPERHCRRRIFIANAESNLVALDARVGTPCQDFGRSGRVDLRLGLRIPPFEPAAYSMTSPPTVVNDIVVVGSSISDNTVPRPASGEVRGFDVRTGELRWTWDPIPQDSADPAFGQWGGRYAHKTGGANAWSIITADPSRDLVFIPTGSAAPDYYGVFRQGDNRYANSVVALRASTGQLVWAFQTVHHDLWDYDNAAPPTLATVRYAGRSRDAVLQATKSGMLFVLDRETGEPIMPIEERPVPSSDVPGEIAAATQPFSVVTPPLSPHRLQPEDVWGPTPDDRSACRAALEGLRNEGVFTPPSPRGTLMLPSNIGGAHWGGVAVDPTRQLAIVPVNRIAAIVQLLPREGFDRATQTATDRMLGHEYEYNAMRETPYLMRRRLFLGPSGLPCTPPPFGSLVAVDLVSGKIRWESPLGALGDPPNPALGAPNLGGPIVTAGGIAFIAAAIDRSLRAVDTETGRELWRGALPASGRATPMTYRSTSGRQFVVIAVGGGDLFGAGDYVIAFHLGN